MTELWELSGTETAALIRKGDISCVDAAQASIDRMHVTNPTLNAVVQDLSEPALERAKALDAQKKANKLGKSASASERKMSSSDSVEIRVNVVSEPEA